MKKVKIILSIIFFVVIMFYTQEIYASSAYLTASGSSVEIGDEFTISINLSDISVATLTARVSVDTTKVQYVSGSANTNFSNGRAIYSWTDASGGQNPVTGGTIATFTFKAIDSGNAYFGLSGEFFDSDEEEISMGYSGASVNIIDNTPETEEPVIEESPPVIEETPEEQVPDISNDNSSVNNEETNNGEQNDWSNPSNEERTVSSNANLKSMQLDVVGVSPTFNKNTTSYWITVPTTIDSIDVVATPENANATVSVEGNNNLSNGKNYIYVRVTAEDGVTKKVYTINVTKSDNEDEINADLNSLAIEGVVLEPEFREDIMEYTVNLENDLEKLNILAFPKIEGASVFIEGNENLKEGENIITIKVSSVNGENEKIYTVKVNKKLKSEVLKENNNNEENAVIQNTKDKGNTFRIVIIIALVIIIVIVVVLIKRYKNNRRNIY